MKLALLCLAGSGLALATATPVTKRTVTDADILNYALTLEHLEATFYEEGLKNYTRDDFIHAGFGDPFYTNLQKIASDEVTHEQFLTQALGAAGATPVERCTYAFPVTDVHSFLSIANVLEGVGVSAYLGAAADIMNGTYLTAAGSILTVEARHSAYLRASMGEMPAAQPFDNPLGLNEVYTVASPFIVSCPSTNPALPVKGFPSLTMSPMGSALTGQKVDLIAGPGYESMNATNVYAAFVTITGPVWAPVAPQAYGTFTVTIPDGVMGQSYVVLTKGNEQATDDSIVAGPAILEISSKKQGTGTGNMSTSAPRPTESTISGTAIMKSSPSTSTRETGMPMFTGGAEDQRAPWWSLLFPGAIGLLALA